MAEILHPVRLGHSGIEVSPLCLGGMSFGEPSPPNFTNGPSAPKKQKKLLDTPLTMASTLSIAQTDTHLAPVKNTSAKQLRICTSPVNSLF